MKGAKSDKKADAKLAVKKTAKGKAAKDPNKPKRPAGPFFIFMEGFRKTYKEDNPGNKSVAAVGKAGGAAWKAMSDEDKKPYVDKAEKRKKDYEKTLSSYNKKLASGAGNEDEDSDKSKSEVNDEDDEEGSEEDEDEE